MIKETRLKHIKVIYADYHQNRKFIEEMGRKISIDLF